MVGVIAINYPDTYTYKPWHVTLLVIAVALVALIFNTFLAQKLPLIEGIILIVHCFGFFGILIPLWVLSPRVPASEVFGSIENRGGWDNNGLACMAGLVGPIYALIGMSRHSWILRWSLLTIYPEKDPTRRFIWVCILLFHDPCRELTPEYSGGNSRCIPGTSYGHGLDTNPQRVHWLGHDYHICVLCGRH